MRSGLVRGCVCGTHVYHFTCWHWLGNLFAGESICVLGRATGGGDCSPNGVSLVLLRVVNHTFHQPWVLLQPVYHLKAPVFWESQSQQCQGVSASLLGVTEAALAGHRGWAFRNIHQFGFRSLTSLSTSQGHAAAERDARGDCFSDMCASLM